MALPGDSWLVPVPNPFPDAASPAGNPNPWGGQGYAGGEPHPPRPLGAAGAHISAPLPLESPCQEDLGAAWTRLPLPASAGGCG